MNFLGHLFFSGSNTTLMAANLMGDFIKGKDLSHLSNVSQQGVFLHRNIDQYIDHHTDVLELAHFLYPILPKVSGIAIDLFFDHLLAKNWQKYHTESLTSFIEAFYGSIDFSNPDFPDHFKLMLGKMIEKNWLYQYQFSHGLYKACNGVSARISFPNKLAQAHTVFEENEAKIELTFHKYMQTAIPHFNTVRSKLIGLK